METPPSRQTQFQFAERLVAGIPQRVFRFDSNARFRSRNKLHAQLLPFDGVPGTKRRDAPRRPEGRHCRKCCIRKTRLDSSAQNNLIVSGGKVRSKSNARQSAACGIARGFQLVALREDSKCEGIPDSEKCGRFESERRYLRRPRTRLKSVP